MVQAIWNGVVIAESEKTVMIENNHYFPPESIKCEYFKKSELHSTCHWKGEASYYNLVVDGKINKEDEHIIDRINKLEKLLSAY